MEPGSDGNVIYKCHVEHGVLSDLNPTVCRVDEQACDDPSHFGRLMPLQTLVAVQIVMHRNQWSVNGTKSS